ncbi:unnamed protein product [Onchocerca flexuosa]|uniref:DUF2969 family protein n=1 Tax=Onchocerca flexuosa TaxID=387005 RepID=A0A183HKK8_9BILA|nr:unnamed protein product [Onchocerca flexuosa]
MKGNDGMKGIEKERGNVKGKEIGKRIEIEDGMIEIADIDIDPHVYGEMMIDAMTAILIDIEIEETTETAADLKYFN